MSDDYVTPVNHSGFSAAASTTAGAATGAVKTGLKAAAIWIGALTLLGVAVGVTLGTGGLGGVGFGGIISGLAQTVFSAPVILGTLFGAGGLALGLGTSWLPGSAGAIAGGFKGGAKASARVENERAAAQEMQAQIAMSKAQASAPYAAMPITNNIYADKYGFPQRGSAMNPALANIQLDGAQLDGTALNPQLAAAR